MSKGIYRILAVNPGSTSTKIAVFDNDTKLLSVKISHDENELSAFDDVQDQLGYRRETIEAALEDKGIDIESIDIYVGRGGGLVNVRSGAFKVTDRLLQDSRKGMAGQHPAQLGSQICRAFADEFGGEAYVYNPPDVDEYDLVARISGLKGVYRQCHAHALNQKEVAIRYAAEIGKRYDEINLIICHIGGGISVTAHRKGKMVDGNDIIRGEGPMTPMRTGSLSAMDMIDVCFNDGATRKSVEDLICRNGGLANHLGTADAREVEKMIAEGDGYAKVVYEAMAYQIAKNAGSCAVALQGDVDGIILTGGLAHSSYLVDFITPYIQWIAPIAVMPGEFEMEALAAGALRVACGEECANTYTGVPVWAGFGEQTGKSRQFDPEGGIS